MWCRTIRGRSRRSWIRSRRCSIRSSTAVANPLGRRWFAGAALVCLLLSFAQSPGLIVADTKYDLTQNPLGFLERASHLWTSQAPLGQVQNQAYGYFFPHGAFFSAGDLLGLPPWVTQRIWWALLLLAGFWGIVRLAESLGVGSRGSRIVAGIAFALSPRVITTLGSISSESLPMMLAPWVLLPLTRIGQESARRLAARSAVAVALMGSVNAVATAAACLVAALWWIAYRPNREWLRFTAWWIPCLLLATAWWLVPLLILGRVSPPFLDYIESSGVTTQWNSLAEVLRGTDSWTAFVSPERIAGAVLVTQPAAVVATGVLAAAGLAGLAMRSMPAKGRLTLILFVGLAGLTAGYVGDLGSPFAGPVQYFLDASGAPLRNVHKLEPLIRLPLVLGLAHLLAQVPLPASVPLRRWRSAFAHPERNPLVGLASLLLVALAVATSLAWTGKLAPRGAYEAVPDYWQETADWLAAHNDSRALIVPGAPFGSQIWGLTRDEPIQALARSPWVSRDAIPLTPPGAIRALDSVQRLIADGRPSTGLAQTLLDQGIGYIVVRNDLDPETSRSTRPLLVHRTIDGSPGFAKVAEFGEPIGAGIVDGLVDDNDLRPEYPAIEIYRVAHEEPLGPYTVDLDTVPFVAGGPESLQRLAEAPSARRGPFLLAADALAAGLPVASATVTDTPTDRETDFGQVDNHSSALRTPGEARRTHNLVPDYPVAGAGLVEGEWSGASISVSSSAADATQLGGTAPGSGPAAMIDGDPATSWISNGLESAVGQWVQLDLDTPITSGVLHLTVSPAAAGAPVKWLEIQTPNGTTAARVVAPGESLTAALPPGHTDWIRILAQRTDDGSAGNQFGISELTLEDYSDRKNPRPVDIRFRTVLPPTPPGATVDGWDLGQELPGRTGCYPGPERVHCAKGLALAPEEHGTFERTLDVPEPTTVVPRIVVRSRQGPALESLLTDPDRVVARGQADIGDVRGSAFAATDGDPRTTWTAPEESVRTPGGRAPTLTIELPAPTLVTGLELTPGLGGLPAVARTVAVDLGAGPQVRDASDTIDLFPQITSRITLSVLDWAPVLDHTAIGFTLLQPTGFAEVTVLGPDGPVFASPPDPDRVIAVGCDQGPVLSVSGRIVRTSVSATVAELGTGAPLTAVPCTTDALDLAAGRQDVVLDPGPLFTADRVLLDAAPAPPAPARTALQPGIWTAALRTLDVPASDVERLIVVPESNNVGWEATGPDGTSLRRVVVNGWQQGWILPAGPGGEVTLRFPADRWYRLGIFGGLTLLIPLLLLVRPRARFVLPWLHKTRTGVGPLPWHTPVLGTCGLFAGSGVVAGIAGPVVVALVLGGTEWLRRRRGNTWAARTLVVLAGSGVALSAAALSQGPWRSLDGYVGHDWWVQLPALLGIVAAGVAALPTRD